MRLKSVIASLLLGAMGAGIGAERLTIPPKVAIDVRDDEPPKMPEPEPDVEYKEVTSTAYCLRGTMANGKEVHRGAVAMNGVPFGTSVEVIDGPWIGTYTVEDRIGHGTELDIWTESCSAAISEYGKRKIHIKIAGRRQP